MEKTDATVAIANSRLTKATALDINGMATSTPVNATREGGRFTVVLPPDVLYVVLTN